MLSIGIMLLYSQTDLQINEGKETYLNSRTLGTPLSGYAVRNNTPDYEIIHGLVGIMSSYYDYFPGNYSSFPLVKQPSPAGFFDGGGLYFVFHSTPEAGSTRRAYYSYILDGQIIGTAIMDTGSQGPEGFAGTDIDKDTGNPFVSWHGRFSGNPDWQTFFSFDQYDAIGFPGLWNEPYCVINNTELEEEVYIWPSVKVGPSPYEGMKRVYVVGTNFAPIEPMPQGGNKYIAFADYAEINDLAAFNPEDWTRYEIPYMREWATRYHRSYDDFVVTSDGKVAVVGTIFDWGSYQDPEWPGGYSEHDALFVLVNENYGEGDTEEDWTLHIEYPNIPVGNPDNFFTEEDGTPLQNLYMVPFAPRFTATVDEDNNLIYPLTYRMSSTQANRLYFNQAYIKFVRFDFAAERFTVKDVWPRSENPEAFPYLPWDPQGDGTWSYNYVEEDSFLVVTNTWPLWWYDNNDFQSENYARITTAGSYVVVVFQECMKARLYHEYGNENYAGWATIPELYIVVSDDGGETWFDPIIINGNPESDFYHPLFAGKTPSYFYPADTIDDLGDDTIRLHLNFFNQNSYGSSIQDNSPPTGGTLYYLALDIMLEDVLGVNGEILPPPASSLHANYPNPFNPSTTISFTLAASEHVNLSIFNVKGQLIKRLVDNHTAAGEHYVTWNGRDEYNREVPSGVYFTRMTTAGTQESRKMLLIK